MSHSVEARVKKGETPASSSSQCSTGVVSAARLGAKVADPPAVSQLVAAPSSRMMPGSSSAWGTTRGEAAPAGVCPNSGRLRSGRPESSSRNALRDVRVRKRIESSPGWFVLSAKRGADQLRGDGLTWRPEDGGVAGDQGLMWFGRVTRKHAVYNRQSGFCDGQTLKRAAGAEAVARVRRRGKMLVDEG